jgi:hypothetical protein
MHSDYAGDVVQWSLLLYHELQNRRVLVRFVVFRDFLFTMSKVFRRSTQRGKREGLFFLRLKWPGHEYYHVLSSLKRVELVLCLTSSYFSASLNNIVYSMKHLRIITI